MTGKVLWLDFNDAARQREEPIDDTDALRAALLDRLEAVLQHLFPQGQIRGGKFYVGDIDGSPGKSLVVELDGPRRGLWKDFADDTGGDTIDAWARSRGLSTRHDFPRIVEEIRQWLGLAQAASPTPPRRDSIAKLEFFNNLRKAAEVAEDGVTTTYPAGYVHLPKVDAEFIQQLCAEQLVTRRDRKGFAIREWQKLRERNEALDCYVYARAAAAAAGLDRFEERHWRELERQLGVERPPDGPPPHSTPSVPEPQEATQRGGLAVSGPRAQPTRTAGRRVIKSRWLTR